MQGTVYRSHVRKIARTILNAHLGNRVPNATKKLICYQLAAIIHAKMYGTTVDGTVSPTFRDIWAELDPQFKAIQTMTEILNEAELEMKEDKVI